MIRHLISDEVARGQEKVDLYFKLSIKKKVDLVDPLNLPIKKRHRQCLMMQRVSL